MIVLLDEPELSLSVSWQKSLISDILSTSNCRYVAIATHSPFIIENFSFENVLALDGGI